MTQPLHFTPKAIADLRALPFIRAPGSATATRYLIEKLEAAQVFVLPDHGELLERNKVRPEVPGIVFRPPFDVVALEYTALDPRRSDPHYTAARSSRRIALAWDWQDDLPAGFGPLRELGPGVMIASIAYMDDAGGWMPMLGAVHLAYDADWQQPADHKLAPFHHAMIERGSVAPAVQAAKAYPVSMLPLMYEVCLEVAKRGGPAAVSDTVQADTADEVNAYLDLCFALACKNVGTREHAAPDALNRQRIKRGKLPLLGFHVLELAGGEMPGRAGGGGPGAKRSHLRRGHIRRLGEGRVTWVNSTIVRGRGFIDKVYAA